jgi:hypothetical protein
MGQTGSFLVILPPIYYKRKPHKCGVFSVGFLFAKTVAKNHENDRKCKYPYNILQNLLLKIFFYFSSTGIYPQLEGKKTMDRKVSVLAVIGKRSNI